MKPKNPLCDDCGTRMVFLCEEPCPQCNCQQYVFCCRLCLASAILHPMGPLERTARKRGIDLKKVTRHPEQMDLLTGVVETPDDERNQNDVGKA